MMQSFGSSDGIMEVGASFFLHSNCTGELPFPCGEQRGLQRRQRANELVSGESSFNRNAYHFFSGELLSGSSSWR